MAVRTHRLHRPHVSLSVAEHLDVHAALKVVTPVPQQPIHLLIKGAGVFPGGFLYLACVANDELFFEQRPAHGHFDALSSRPGRILRRDAGRLISPLGGP